MKNKYAKQSEELQAQRKAAKAEQKRKRMCTEKIAYSTLEQAHEIGNEVYKCHYCQQYHVTTKMSKLLNMIRATRKRVFKKSKKKKSGTKLKNSYKIEGIKVKVKKLN